MTNITPQINSTITQESQAIEKFSVKACGGTHHVHWDNEQPFTPLGQLVFFAQFLECAGLFKSLVKTCPLEYASNNAPAIKDVMGTLLCAILSGQNRYQHMERLYNDKVTASVLGLNKFVSDDSARRGVKKMDEEKALKWIDSHLEQCNSPLLRNPWILDLDSTVKPVFGKQEGSAIGYNPARPGRPSYSYHSYFMANTRILLGVDVRPGNEHAGSFAWAGLFKYLDSLDEDQKPHLIRGDVSYGSENGMSKCEIRKLHYLFKLRLSTGVKELVKLCSGAQDWVDAGKGWQGCKRRLKLEGWTQERNVIVMRMPLIKKKVEAKKLVENCEQQLLFPEIIIEQQQEYTYSILVTSLDEPVMTIAQHYRDRGDCENNYDEAKNQWGWGGYVTRDLGSTRIMAALVALISNWWNIYARLAIPERHAEAITSRPLLLHGVGRLIRTGGQSIIRISSNNAYADKIAETTQKISHFLKNLTAEQSSVKERWKRITAQAFIVFLHAARPPTPAQIETAQ